MTNTCTLTALDLFGSWVTKEIQKECLSLETLRLAKVEPTMIFCMGRSSIN